MEALALLTALGALSLTVTKSVDLVRNVFDKADAAAQWVWSVAALAIGVAYCVGWQINLAQSALALVPALHGSEAAQASVAGFPGYLLTGLAAGAGAGFFHELLDALSSYAKSKKPVP